MILQRSHEPVGIRAMHAEPARRFVNGQRPSSVREDFENSDAPAQGLRPCWRRRCGDHRLLLDMSALLRPFPPSYTICSKVELRVHISNTRQGTSTQQSEERESNNAVSPSRVRIAEASDTTRRRNRHRPPA